MQRKKQGVRAALHAVVAVCTALLASAAAAQEPPVVIVGAQPAETSPPKSTPNAGTHEPTLELSLGFSGLISGAWIGDHVTVHGSSGLDVSLRVLPWLYFGARRVGVAWASPIAGDRFAIGGAPMVGFALGLDEVVELFGELGAALQSRFGDQASAFGVAPFAGIGVRFRLAEWISLGLDGTLHVPVTDAFLVHNAVLPRGAVWVAGGAGVLFHIR